MSNTAIVVITRISNKMKGEVYKSVSELKAEGSFYVLHKEKCGMVVRQIFIPMNDIYEMVAFSEDEYEEWCKI